MSPRKAARKLTVAQRRGLEVAAALAREAVTQFHVSSAISLIELANGRVSAVRMLEIYLRMHNVTGPKGELLAYSVLAALGHRASKGKAASLVVDGEDGAAPDSTALFRLLRMRLRGRVHHDLRRWVELATGSAQAGLIEIHVRHAVRFARELADTHSVSQACDLYVDMAGVPSTLRESLQIHLLDRLAAEELPRPYPALDPQNRVALHAHRPRRVV
jgi:hypothetical protein